MTGIHNMARGLTLLILISPAMQAQSPGTHDPYVFAYFKEPGSQGMYLALSRDGYTYTPLNDGQPWLRPEQPDEIMRDIYVTRTPDSGFRAVWTWGWHGNSIGTATSRDLLTWSPQQRVELMQAFPSVQNTWAPETYWDAEQHQWLILWSSSFKPSGTTDEKADGLRLWAAHTSDWTTFTTPAKFFDRGFPVIDATLFHRDFRGKQDVVMVLKDQTADPLRYDERWTAGPSVEGPWEPLSAPINESWSEGPSVVQVGKEFIVFYDHYRPPRPRYEAVETSDWVHWRDATEKISMPIACKHGSFLRVTEAEAERLLARHDASETPPAVPNANVPDTP